MVSELCTMESEPDGVMFDATSVKAARIKEDADYAGVRVQFRATLAGARIPMQIDVDFGDVIFPGTTRMEYPTLLAFPAPLLQAYPKETVIAEKLEALTALATLNSRMKDFFDLWALPSLPLRRTVHWSRRSRRRLTIARLRSIRHLTDWPTCR
jgi:hypothetical protein